MSPPRSVCPRSWSRLSNRNRSRAEPAKFFAMHTYRSINNLHRRETMTSTRRSRTWTLVLVSAALFMVTLDNLVVTTALPKIRIDLGASLSGLEWIVNAYTLSFAVLLLVGAALGDRFGRRRIMSIGLSVFTAASAIAAVAPTTSVLITARAVQGAGAAMVLPLTLTLLSEAFPPGRRGVALGIW